MKLITLEVLVDDDSRVSVNELADTLAIIHGEVEQVRHNGEILCYRDGAISLHRILIGERSQSARML